MKLSIIFEDREILVIDKPSGLVVNNAQTAHEETLQDQLSSYFKLNDLGIGDRAGIVHRLDRETSGLLIVAKTQKSFEFLQNEFKERSVQKKYKALVHGKINDFGTIESKIKRIGIFGKFGVAKLREDGREAVTDYNREKILIIKDEVLNTFLNDGNLSKSRSNYLKNHAKLYSLVTLFPKSGRTHQIRVHLKSIGHPVVSDSIYTPRKLLNFDLMWCKRLFLHAEILEFRHPATKKIVSFNSELPNDLNKAVDNLTLR